MATRDDTEQGGLRGLCDGAVDFADRSDPSTGPNLLKRADEIFEPTEDGKLKFKTRPEFSLSAG